MASQYVLPAAIRTKTAAFIERHNLHSGTLSIPVSIRQAARDEGWIVRFREGMAPAYAIAVVTERTRLALVNADVSPAYQRLALAHEIGHTLCDHASGLHLCAETGTLGAWAHRKQERQADMAAALLLVPGWAFESGRTLDEVAAACGCPVWLAGLRSRLR